MGSRIVIDVTEATIEAYAANPTGPIVLHMVELSERVKERGRKNASGGVVNRRSGTLEDSIDITPPIIGGGRIVVGVEATAPYALAVHQGSKPHVIVPRTARVLAWEGEGGPVFARRVNHPGSAGKPFLSDALEAINL